MSDTRSRQCLMNIEPMLFELLNNHVLTPNRSSISGYLRSLVVADLQRRDLLSNDILTMLALGTPNVA